MLPIMGGIITSMGIIGVDEARAKARGKEGREGSVGYGGKKGKEEKESSSISRKYCHGALPCFIA